MKTKYIFYENISEKVSGKVIKLTLNKKVVLRECQFHYQEGSVEPFPPLTLIGFKGSILVCDNVSPEMKYLYPLCLAIILKCISYIL